MIIHIVVVDFLLLDLLFLLVLEPVALLLFLAVVLRGGAETRVFAFLGLLPVPVTRALQMAVLLRKPNIHFEAKLFFLSKSSATKNH